MKLIANSWCKRILVSALLLLLTACETLSFNSQESEEPIVITGPETAPEVPPVPEAEKTRPPEMVIMQTDCPPIDGRNVIGEVEWVTVQPEGVRQKARIDTGAQTTSMGVITTQKFERDGKPWVAFTIKDRESGSLVDMKRPLLRVAKIKRHNAEPLERFVVSLTLTMGELSDVAEVTLADREKFEFPVLIGRNFLDGTAVVDVSKKFLTLETPPVSQVGQ